MDPSETVWGSTPDSVFSEIGEAMEAMIERSDGSAVAAGSAITKNAFTVKNVRPLESGEPGKLKSVRLTNKSTVINWDNGNGSGRLFNATLMDASGEIQLNGFNSAVDRFYDLLRVGSVYDLENFCIQRARKDFNRLSHPFEIVLYKDSVIVEALPGNPPPPLIRLEIMPFSELGSKGDGCIVDAIGICVTFKALHIVSAKGSGRELVKRDIHLVGYDCFEVVLSIWNELAKSFSPTTFPLVVCVKGAKVNSFRAQKCLTTIPSSQLMINPDCIEASDLRTWYLTKGYKIVPVRYLSRPIEDSIPSHLIAEIEIDSHNRRYEEGMNFKCLATILDLRTDNALFPACRRCKRKVLPIEHAESEQAGAVRMVKCETCKSTLTSTEVSSRLILRIKFGDISGSVWAKVFLEESEVLFGESAASLVLSYCKDKEKFTRMAESLRFKRFDVTLYVKGAKEHKGRLTVSCTNVAKIDFLSRSVQMQRELMG